MAGPRTPTNVLKLRGADKQHPERIRERDAEPVDSRALGGPPSRLDKEQKKAWKVITDHIIPGVAMKADAPYIEMASRLMALTWDGTATSADYTRLEAMLGKLGMNPADRSKIQMPDKGTKNRFTD